MSEGKPENHEASDREGNSLADKNGEVLGIKSFGKSFLQWLSAPNGLGVALIGAVAGYGIATIQVGAEREKSQLEARLEEAKIFQTLLQQASEEKDPAFVVLALSKVFPADMKLIVTTAMMNPNETTASALKAIGADENLLDYQDTIKGIMVNANEDRQQGFNAAYGETFPKFVMDVNYEVAVRSGGNNIKGLLNVISNHSNLVPSLRSLISSDERVRKDIELRATLARSLYDIDSTLMTELLSEAAEDQKLLEIVARLYSNQVNNLRDDVPDRISKLALAYLEANVGKGGSQQHLADMMLLLKDLDPYRHLSQDERNELKELSEEFFIEFARLGRAPSIGLQTLNILSVDDEAEDLYFQALVCLNPTYAEVFFREFPTMELGISNWDDSKPFGKDVVDEAEGRLREGNYNCEGWE